MSSDLPQQRTVHFHGMVQGVGFRYTTRKVASRFDVTGFVQNLPDGRVRLVAEGQVGELDRFLGAVRRQMDRYIENEEETNGPATGSFEGFDIRF